MLPTKFQNWLLGLGEEAKKRFSRWPPCGEVKLFKDSMILYMFIAQELGADNPWGYLAFFYNELKRPAKQVVISSYYRYCESLTYYAEEFACGDWFPISTAECIGLILNPETNANKAGAICLVSKKYDE